MILRAACIQLNSGPDFGPNLEMAAGLARQARAAGADFILTPENTAMMQADQGLLLEKTPPQPEHPAPPFFSSLARELGAWMLLGSVAVRLDDGRLANRSFLFDAAGRTVATYDKIHMFDVDLGEGEVYRESAAFRPGDRLVKAETPWGILGLSICYDLRFPRLYRKLAQAGAGMIAVPAAFTQKTGQAHWHALLRARAIENGCWVLAPAQCGMHAGGRRTFGHSLIIDPWGRVMEDAGESPGFVMAEIDMNRVKEARNKVPSLSHDRALDFFT